MATSVIRRRKIGQHLVAKGRIREEDLARALETQTGSGRRLGDVLVTMKLLSRQVFFEALAEHLGMPLVTLEDLRGRIRPEVAGVIPRTFAEHNLVLPYSRDGETLRILSAGPLDPWLVEFVLGCAGARRCEAALASEEDVRAAIREAWEPVAPDPEISADEEREMDAEEIAADAEAPRILNRLLLAALHQRASDIHIEQYTRKVVTRFRIDGHLRPAEEALVHKDCVRRVVSKIKLECNLDISESRKPQDGSFSRRFADRDNPVDFRVALQPTLHGENVIIRILDQKRSLPALEDIGLQPAVLHRYRRLIENPQGLILFTGPTGSGKTTSLYATLDLLRREPIKIITAEDPVEYTFEGIQQCQVNDLIGNSFARFMRSFLRQDPDVILVGEIRDADTAEFAIRAALTGHLVFSTLHTNDTVGTVRRLLSMKIDPDLVARSLLCVVAQRLVRSVCRACQEAHEPGQGDEEEFYRAGRPGEAAFRRGRGCGECGFTGFRGRLPIFEFWEIDEAAVPLIQRTADETEMRDAALRSGLVSMVEDGLAKAEAGLTTLDELRSVIPYLQIQAHRRRAGAARHPNPNCQGIGVA